MNWQELKWKPIVAGFAAALAILLIGNYLWRRTAVERPLIQVLLQNEAVADAVFHSDGPNSRVEVVVKDVPRLADAVHSINATVEKMQPNVSQVEFIDNTDGALTQLYDELHFAIFEAKVTGSFVKLNERFLATVSGQGLTAHRLEVDDEAIYLQLHRGDYYLYRVVALEVTAK